MYFGCHFEYRLVICRTFSYVVNIESWSPSNSIGSPSYSTVYRPTMSAMPTDLDVGKKHNSMHVLIM